MNLWSLFSDLGHNSFSKYSLHISCPTHQMKHMTHRRAELNFLLSLSLAIFKSPFQSYLEPLSFPLIHWNVSLEGDRRLVWDAFPVGHRKICTWCFLSGTVLDTYALFTFYELAKESHLPGRAQRTLKHRGVTVLKMACVPTGRVRLLTQRIPSLSSDFQSLWCKVSQMPHCSSILAGTSWGWHFSHE